MTLTTCQTCGHHSESDVVKGKLRVQSIPPGVFWRGRYLNNLTPSHIRFMRELARREWTSHFLLDMTCRHESAMSQSGVAVVICHMRKKLPAGIAIEHQRGKGYRLILED